MSGLSQAAFARAAGVSKQAIGKAARQGRVVIGADGALDPAEPANARWIETHRQGRDNRGRPLASHVGGRPAGNSAALPGGSAMGPPKPALELAAEPVPAAGALADIVEKQRAQDDALLGVLETFERRLQRIEALAIAGADRASASAEVIVALLDREAARAAQLGAAVDALRGLLGELLRVLRGARLAATGAAGA